MGRFEARRKAMVDGQIIGRGIRDPRVLAAVGRVPREVFVPRELARYAYADRPLPIGEGQTISQPYVVALMSEAARISEGARVLEIGTGSGYGAAVLAELGAQVYTIERNPNLAELAKSHLAQAGYPHVHVAIGDGTFGLAPYAPFDAILVTAGAPEVPGALLDQLTLGGRLVIPIGPTQAAQRLMRIERRDHDRFEREDLGAVRFVPLIGAQGWPNSGVQPG